MSNRALIAFVLLSACPIFAEGRVPDTTEVEPHAFPWRTDYAAALAEAGQNGRPLLLKFTGSDWCPPCKRLNREVFETEAMRSFAEAEIIAVYVDFPRGFKLDPALAQQNNALAETFDVKSYPTVWIVSPAGEPIGKLGYQEGGPKSYIRRIKRLLREAQSTAP